MQEYTEPIAGALVSMEQDVKEEFEARLAESSKLAFRVAYSVLRNSENAEDVAQDAFAKAYSNFRQLRDRNHFRAWLVRTVWRTAITRLRSDSRRVTREGSPLDSSTTPTPIQSILEKERSARLWQAIDVLPEKLRLVVILSAIEEHDTHEVALLLQIPDGTVKSRLFLARQRLRELLQ